MWQLNGPTPSSAKELADQARILWRRYSEALAASRLVAEENTNLTRQIEQLNAKLIQLTNRITLLNNIIYASAAYYNDILNLRQHLIKEIEELTFALNVTQNNYACAMASAIAANEENALLRNENALLRSLLRSTMHPSEA